MPKVSRSKKLNLYRLEEKLCVNMRPSQDWVVKNEILENLTRFQSDVSPRSRVLANIFNPKQYKILNVSTPFLSPFSVIYKKKVAHVIYRLNIKPTECEHSLLPLFTSFPLWEYLLTRPYQVSSISIAQLHSLFPQWSVEDWTLVVEKLDNVFKQINDANTLRSEMKRIMLTESSHYPWWKDEGTIRTVHEDIEFKLKTLEYTKPQEHKQFAPTKLTGQLYLTVPIQSFEYQSELLSLSQALYDYFRQQVSMADIQYQVWQCNINRDQPKSAIESSLDITIHEQFPNQYERLKTYFQYHIPKPSNEYLFKIWQQSRGNWDIIQLI